MVLFGASDHEVMWQECGEAGPRDRRESNRSATVGDDDDNDNGAVGDTIDGFC